MGKRAWWMGWSLLLMASMAHAGGAGAVRKQLEASMLVTGQITVDQAGRVADYSIDSQDQLPAGVLEFVRANVPGWTFQPQRVNGQPVGARNRMRILLVAKKQDDGDYLMRLRSATFQPLSELEGYEIDSRDMAPPRYPVGAARAGVGGTVYLILKVGRDGKVQDAFAEQVNLRAVATEGTMDKVRRMFADSALSAARRWSFVPPTKGEQAEAAYWTVRTPVDYYMGHDGEPRYGVWQAYVPGPRQSADWVDKELAATSPEALAGGSTHLVTKDGLRLLTPLAQEG